MPEQSGYQDKKAFFNRVLTVYGRKPSLETLRDPQLDIHAVHLARSNRETGIVAEIIAHAESRQVPVHTHTREQLARISRNGKQDQGVAVDVVCPGFRLLDEYLEQTEARRRLLALDGVHNPQNLGMIIRAAAAGDLDGILLPERGNASLGPLAIKASAGTVFRAPLIRCDALLPALANCQAAGAEICVLDAAASRSLFEHRPAEFCIYVLGNEAEGVSNDVTERADTRLAVPMRNGVESLNVAVTASLIAFSHYLER